MWIFTQHGFFSTVCARQGDGSHGQLDYDNFKSEVAHHQGSDGAAYEHSLHEVWSVMYRLQSSPHMKEGHARR